VLLERFMQSAVMQTVSNGVLRHQAKQIEQTEKKCRITSESGSTFVIKEVIEKKLSKDWIIRREAQRIVTWDVETDDVSCSCNSQVYRGMPCKHVALVAIEKNYQIPLSCFNKRYFYSYLPFSLPEGDHCADSPRPPASPSRPPSPQEPHPPDEANVEFIPGPEQHITEAFINAKFGDEDSIRIRGEIRSLEIYILSVFKPRTNLAEVLDTIRTMKSSIQARITESHSENDVQESQVAVPHASHPIRKNSYKEVPLRVAEACAEAMKRNDPSPPYPPAKRSSTAQGTGISSSTLSETHETTENQGGTGISSSSLHETMENQDGTGTRTGTSSSTFETYETTENQGGTEDRSCPSTLSLPCHAEFMS